MSLSEDFQEMRMERVVTQWKERAAMSRLQVEQLNQKELEPIDKELLQFRCLL